MSVKTNGACFWAGHALCIAPSGDVSICLLSHCSSGIIGNLVNDRVEDVVARGVSFSQATIEGCAANDTLSHNFSLAA
jgi:hypothetical protein